jgi:hypothetical protein
MVLLLCSKTGYKMQNHLIKSNFNRSVIDKENCDNNVINNCVQHLMKSFYRSGKGNYKNNKISKPKKEIKSRLKILNTPFKNTVYTQEYLDTIYNKDSSLKEEKRKEFLKE